MPSRVQDVRNLAGAIISGSRPSLAAVGPLDGLIDQDKLAERFGVRMEI